MVPIVRPLTDIEKARFDVIEKMTAIVGHCELLELDADDKCTERLEKIKALAMDGADVLRTFFMRDERVEAQQELFL